MARQRGLSCQSRRPPQVRGTSSGRDACHRTKRRFTRSLSRGGCCAGALPGCPRRGCSRTWTRGREPGTSSLVRVRRRRPGRPPVLLPGEIQAIMDGCATWDEAAGDLRDRLIFAMLAERDGDEAV